ncbi:MAG: hypothetical protein EXR72_03975 [Myxococcales bacterium]|nr:hypothetical protein [Myxococcales bacterium]
MVLKGLLPHALRLALLLTASLPACKDAEPGLGPDEIPVQVASRCPGDPSCPDRGDGQIHVGYGVRDITPQLEPFEDRNGNQRRDFDEPFTDRDGDGKFDDYYVFNTGKPITGVHDPIWARCWVIRQNETTLAHCALDVGGYMYDEVLQIRKLLDPSLGVDYFLASATHNHSAPDTVGIFGPDDTLTGYRPQWMAEVRQKVADAVGDAVKSARPAKMSIASLATEEAGHDMRRIIDDTRDPVIIDNVMHLLQFDSADDGKPIVTVLNWTAHPDSNSRGNHLISSEFPHDLRLDVEKHAGSPVVYVSGALGGQIGPGRLRPVAADGKEVPCDERSFRFIEAWAHDIARYANRAFDARVPVAAPKLSFAAAHLEVHIENVGYHTAFALHLIPREFHGFDPKRPLIRDENGDNSPLVDTEIAYLRIGPAAIATAPGELLPELFIGGYDGSRAGKWEPFVHTGPVVEWCDPGKSRNEGDYLGPPDVSLAPKPPYLFDEMGGDPAHRMVFGLTLDMLGYIVPQYNWYLDPVAPYLQEPPGDSHYEETNSIGPRAAPEIVGSQRQLVRITEGKKP